MPTAQQDRMLCNPVLWRNCQQGLQGIKMGTLCRRVYPVNRAAAGHVCSVCMQVFILEGAGMQAAAYIHPNQDDLSTYQNIPQSLLLRFAIAAVWFLILGLAQVRAGTNQRCLCQLMVQLAVLMVLSC